MWLVYIKRRQSFLRFFSGRTVCYMGEPRICKKNFENFTDFLKVSLQSCKAKWENIQISTETDSEKVVWFKGGLRSRSLIFSLFLRIFSEKLLRSIEYNTLHFKYLSTNFYCNIPKNEPCITVLLCNRNRVSACTYTLVLFSSGDVKHYGVQER